MKPGADLSPSSRSEFGEEFPAGAGIDTIAVTVACLEEPPVLAGERRFVEVVDEATGEIQTRHQAAPLALGPGVHRAALRRRSRHGWCVEFECSVPKLLTGSNASPASRTDVHEALSHVRDRLVETDGIVVDTASAWLRRLDLVRDFHGLGDPVKVLDALQDRTPDRSDVAMESHYQPWLGVARVTEVVRRTRDYRIRLYDKSFESRRTACPAPGGQLRFELQLRRDALRGLRELGGLRAERLTALMQHMFRRMRYDQPLELSSSGALVAMWEGMTPAQQRLVPMALGLAQLETDGIAPVQDAKTLRKYRDVQILLPAPEAARAGWAVLDFQSGRLLRAAPNQRAVSDLPAAHEIER